MERRRAGSPVYSRQVSGGSSSTGSSSPVMSPAHHRAYSAAGGMSTIRRTQNVAAKAAAARLAQVMASQTAVDDDDDEEEDDVLPSNTPRSRLGTLRLSSNDGGGAAGAASGKAARSPSPAVNILGQNFMEHIPPVRTTSAGRPSVSARPTTVVPPSRTSVRTPSPIPILEPPVEKYRDKRFLTDFGQGYMNAKETGNHREAPALQDELDMLLEENENLLDRLRLAEERYKEAEARARELEKQVANLGEGVSLEARLLSRKEAALRQREAALKAVQQTSEGRDEEIVALRQEIVAAKTEAVNAIEQFQGAKSEAKALQSMTERMILTEEEMEEVVLKRCWLARYWGLAAQYGIYPEIAVSKHEHWSSLAPLPFEVVISAGQKTKEDSWSQDLKSSGDLKFVEAVELNQEESEDILFKQAWLIYFWRRAKSHGVEEELAEDRLEFWIGRSGQPSTSHDAVDVERGLNEMRKLGIEKLLWEASRREIDQGSLTAE
ncbi:hypothetical protein Taro_010439 [Colocasia esculenta]|uniref:Coiled-coil domain-containing protein SCD2 n=1 Tax=Colocasia esculenta TaxID=4460 RepID=A0A843U339_COLES|nr:hypothetical protein [Colocasia esculenta]